MLKVLVFEPEKNGYVKEIDGSLKSMQEIVGGYIQAVDIVEFDDTAVIVCGEEGKLKEKPLNIWLKNKDGAIVDCVCGTCFIVNALPDDEDF